MDWRSAGALAALAIFALAPQDAAAQTTFRDRGDNQNVADRSRPDYEPDGVAFGAFIINPLLEAGVESTDNFFANDFNAGAEDEIMYTLRGHADIESGWSRHALKITLGAQRSIHDEFPKDDATTGVAAAELRLDVTRNTEIGGGARFEQMIEERTAPDAVFSAVKPVEYSYDDVFLYGGHTFNRVRVSARAAHREYNYDDSFRLDPVTIAPIAIDQDYRDYESDIGTMRVEYLVSPRMALLLEGVWNEREYDAFGRSSHGRTFTTGASFELARLVDGEVRVGYLEQEYDDPTVGTVEGLAVNADIDWYPTQLTSISLAVDRQVEDSGALGNASYLLTRVGASIDHELYRNVVLSLGASAGEREYNGIDRNDDYSSIDLTGVYLLNRNVSLRAGLSREQVNSDGLARNRDFEIHRAFVSLAFRA